MRTRKTPYLNTFHTVAGLQKILKVLSLLPGSQATLKMNVVLRQIHLHQACNFIKKEPLAQVFSYEFCEIFKNTYFHRTPLGGVSDDSISISSVTSSMTLSGICADKRW